MSCDDFPIHPYACHLWVMLFGLANDSLAILFLIQALLPKPINNDPQMTCLIMYENPNHVMIVLKLQKTNDFKLCWQPRMKIVQHDHHWVRRCLMFCGTFLIHKYYNNIIHTCLINSNVTWIRGWTMNTKDSTLMIHSLVPFYKIWTSSQKCFILNTQGYLIVQGFQLESLRWSNIKLLFLYSHVTHVASDKETYQKKHYQDTRMA